MKRVPKQLGVQVATELVPNPLVSRAARLSVVGADPGLAAFGLCHLTWTKRCELADDPSDWTVRRVDVFTSRPEDKKLGVRSADDVDRRVESLWTWLRAFITEARPRVICCEAMSYPRRATAAAKAAMARALLVAIATELKIPFLIASPQRVRDVVIGKNIVNGKRIAASKSSLEMVIKARLRPEPALWQGIALGARNHAWDAIGTVLANEDTDVMRLLLG